MKQFNNEMELKKAYAIHMNERCDDDFYFNHIDRVELYTLNGGYTPMNAKDMGIITKSKHISYIPEFGYTEEM